MGYKALGNPCNITKVVSLGTSSGQVDNILSFDALHFHCRKKEKLKFLAITLICNIFYGLCNFSNCTGKPTTFITVEVPKSRNTLWPKQGGNAPDSYLGGTGFKSRAGHRQF
jgi:hypothetical protein